MGGDILHDLSRSLILRRRQLPILSAAGKLLLLLATINRDGLAQTQEGTLAARQLAGIDSEYSRLSLEKGMPAASVAYFSDGGIAFAPNLVNGKKYWSTRKDFPKVLVWQPVFAAIAHAGDLGYTTGPWELRPRESTRPDSFGHYVTVWKKEKEDWKIALDIGIENPEPTESPGALTVLPAEATAGERAVEDSRRALQKTQRRFLEAARKDVGLALAESLADEVRIYRDKSAPAVGVAAARLLLGSEHARVNRSFGGTDLSSSGDLAYVYGTYSAERGNNHERGIYVTIWRVNLNGDWNIALDLTKKPAAAE